MRLFSPIRIRVAGLAAVLLAAGSALVALPAGALPADVPGAALLASADGNGYSILDTRAARYDYGSSAPAQAQGRVDEPDAAQSLPSSTRVDSPVVGAASTPDGSGTWIATRNGDVLTTGSARSYGHLAARTPSVVVTDIVATPGGRGYWLVGADGRVFPFGTADFHGSLPAVVDAGDVVAMTATPSGRGYRLLTDRGAVFAFGDAALLGQPQLDRKVPGEPERVTPRAVALLDSPTGRGYLVVADDGSVSAHGDAQSPGTLAGTHLVSPVVDAVPSSSGTGAWLLTRDGGVVALRAPFYGSAADETDLHPTSVSAPYYPGGRPTVDGAAGGLVALRCAGGNGAGGTGGIVVSAAVARQLSDLIADAAADGIALCATSSFRNSAQQIALRAKYCSDVFDPAATCTRPVALPGRSMHEQGLAIDFRTTSAGYAWLAAKASGFGWHHLPGDGLRVEPWHYSATGG